MNKKELIAKFRDAHRRIAGHDRNGAESYHG